MCRRHHCGHDESAEDYANDESTGTEDGAGTTLPLSRRGMLAATGGALGGAAASGSASAHAPWEKNPYAHEVDYAHWSNYSDSSRRCGDYDWVVPHVTASSFGSAVNWFKDPDADVSAHYVIRNSDGYCKQMVLDEDVAWHAAGFNSPSIGIEHEWYDGMGPLSTDNLWRSARIARHIAEECDIPLEYYTDPCVAKDAPGGFVGHTDAPKNYTCDSSTKSCPWPPWDWERYMRLLFRAGGKNIPEGYYKIENLNSGKALDVAYASDDDGANIQQYTYGGYDHQQFYADYLGGGQYRLIARHSDKVADVENGSTDNNANIQQYHWNGTDAQKFWIVPAGDYYRIVNKKSFKVFDVAYWSKENNANVQQYTWGRQANQKWALTPV